MLITAPCSGVVLEHLRGSVMYEFYDLLIIRWLASMLVHVLWAKHSVIVTVFSVNFKFCDSEKQFSSTDEAHRGQSSHSGQVHA